MKLEDFCVKIVGALDIVLPLLLGAIGTKSALDGRTFEALLIIIILAQFGHEQALNRQLNTIVNKI